MHQEWSLFISDLVLLELFYDIYILSVVTVLTCCILFIILSIVFFLWLGLLSEIEGLKFLTALARTSINEPIEVLSVLFCVTVLVYKFFNSKVASSYSNNDLVSFNFHEDSLLTILVNALWFSYKVHLLSKLRRSSINILSKFDINRVVLHRLIDKQCALTLL